MSLELETAKNPETLRRVAEASGGTYTPQPSPTRN